MSRVRGSLLSARRLLHVLAAWGVLAAVVLAGGSTVARGQEASGLPESYEAVATAEGFRFSFSAPGFVAVDTFVDAGGPVSQSVIDGLGNSRAFASLPYPGDLAISGPGTVAGLTGLPSPPPYPFYVSSSHPTSPEAKLAHPGFELAVTSGESSSQGSATTGGRAGSGSGSSAVGSTVAKALTSIDAGSGLVTAEATGGADVIDVGGVLRIGQVTARAKVTRGPGAEPTREASFAIDGMTVAGQSVGFSEKGLTLAGTNVPLPPGSPLTEALAQANITVEYLDRIDTPDGVVSPGVVIRQEQAISGGPNLVLRYVFGQMAASATVSGSSTSIGGSLPPTGTGVSDTPVISAPGDSSGFEAGGLDVADSGSVSPTEPTPEVAAPVPGAAAPGAALPSAATTVVDTASIYLILVAAAAVALLGGTVLRLVGVNLKGAS